MLGDGNEGPFWSVLCTIWVLPLISRNCHILDIPHIKHVGNLSVLHGCSPASPNRSTKESEIPRLRAFHVILGDHIKCNSFCKEGPLDG